MVRHVYSSDVVMMNQSFSAVGLTVSMFAEQQSLIVCLCIACWAKHRSHGPAQFQDGLDVIVALPGASGECSHGHNSSPSLAGVNRSSIRTRLHCYWTTALQDSRRLAEPLADRHVDRQAINVGEDLIRGFEQTPLADEDADRSPRAKTSMFRSTFRRWLGGFKTQIISE